MLAEAALKRANASPSIAPQFSEGKMWRALGPVDIQVNQIQAAANAMNEEKQLASLS